MAHNVLGPVRLISAASMGASVTSSALSVKYQDNLGVQLQWTGTPVGTFDIQVSADHVQDMFGNVQVPGTWISISPSTPVATAVGSADQVFIDINQVSSLYIRIVYTRTSGTGVLGAYVVGKAV